MNEGRAEEIIGELVAAINLALQLTDSGGHDGASENCPTCHFVNVARAAIAKAESA